MSPYRPAHVFTSEDPELFFDHRDGEYSVMLPSGECLADMVASDWPDPRVQLLGEQAIRLNGLQS